MRRSSASSPRPRRAGRPTTLTWEWNSVRADHRFPRHAHRDWSFGVVCGGVGFVDVGGTVHEAHSGAITVLHPGESHRSWTHPTSGLDYVVITVTKAEAATLHGGRAAPTFTEHVIEDPGCAGALLTACESRFGDAATPVAGALALLFGTHARDEDTSLSPSPVVRVLREYLDDHYAVPVSLSDMAALARVSQATLVRRFHADLGLAPHEYLVSRRIDAARAMVRSGLPLPEIAQLTGFADQSHLHRHFTRIVGVTPGRYRRN
ncbi:helix-turn-helix domain-containing protein [Actinomadura syzygii]|uniref:Helix-turn-helix transcriptional regulator n=1 Tax=Actinomadura syzygii TaxID=1427538 RepID=A0A5D0TT92_9ACTN|nr:AraC family transcriptional regulator [Actinomadura syzygii]TYC08953.1 helix-turn-helix transcriptional regulator [Actinomadura syzygii]